MHAQRKKTPTPFLRRTSCVFSRGRRVDEMPARDLPRLPSVYAVPWSRKTVMYPRPAPPPNPFATPATSRAVTPYTSSRPSSADPLALLMPSLVSASSIPSRAATPSAHGSRLGTPLRLRRGPESVGPSSADMPLLTGSEPGLYLSTRERSPRPVLYTTDDRGLNQKPVPWHKKKVGPQCYRHIGSVGYQPLSLYSNSTVCSLHMTEGRWDMMERTMRAVATPGPGSYSPA